MVLMEKGRLLSSNLLKNEVQFRAVSYSQVSWFSLSAIIFMLRRESIDSGHGRQLLYIFTIHCVVCLTVGLWEVIDMEFRIHLPMEGMDTGRILYIIYVLLASFWVTAGVSTVVRWRRLST
jgi:hypothetical protein